MELTLVEQNIQTGDLANDEIININRFLILVTKVFNSSTLWLASLSNVILHNIAFN